MTATFVEPGPDFRSFVRGYRHTAFRFEVRDRYNEPSEVEEIRRFEAGRPLSAEFVEPWRTMMRERTADGARMTRVRVVTEPHSAYTRFALHLGALNVAAGEDIRYLPRHSPAVAELPDHDWWLIDSTRVGVLRFADDDVLLGAELIDDPEMVVRYNYWRDVALHYATPLGEYVGDQG